MELLNIVIIVNIYGKSMEENMNDTYPQRLRGHGDHQAAIVVLAAGGGGSSWQLVTTCRCYWQYRRCPTAIEYHPQMTAAESMVRWEW